MVPAYSSERGDIMASKGKPKPRLRDLSRQSPTTEELNSLLETFDEGPPVVCAILGQAIVEHALEKLLRTRFPRKDDTTWGRLTSENGPLNTFAQKITAGYAFKLYDEDALRNLKILRDIRNVFAHSKRLIDFTHELIASELKGAALPKAKRSKLALSIGMVRRGAPRHAYVVLCFALFIEFTNRRMRGDVAAMRNFKRRTQKLMGSSPHFGPLSMIGLSE